MQQKERRRLARQEDLQDHLLIEKAKRVKGKAMTLEEYEAIRAYDASKASSDEGIPFEQAMREIKKPRRR